MKKRTKKISKKAQLTIFIIIAILIVAGIIFYFVLRESSDNSIPQNMRPVYDNYLSCLQQNAKQGASLLGEQGGYIELPLYELGSSYMPFSSQLDFLGQPVPYWMYVSGRNIVKEQVPSKDSMERQLEKYINDRLDYCDFSDFNRQGFDVFIENGNVKVVIEDTKINLEVNNPVIIYFENQSVELNEHKLSIDSKLGKFYDLALETYNFEKQNMFLEDYSLDVMRLYAPVTGVDISCAPKVFVEENIRKEISDALEANINMLKLKGNYYELKDKDYFVTDLGKDVDENVNFIYSSKFPTRIEIYGDKIAEPIGLQAGLGAMGFCYVPYNLVYDINFPVLVQFYNAGEIFQFPMSVIINKNQARNKLEATAEKSIENDVCSYANQEVKVYTYDSELNPVESRIRFQCFNSDCYIGETKINGTGAQLNEMFPQCVNGMIIASADNFADTKYQISTNEENVANIVLDRLYNLPIKLNVEKNVLISFSSDSYSKTILYPEFKEVELIEGYYNISIYAFDNSSLKLPALTNKKCVNVPKSGIGGVFGIEEEKCFNVNIPEQEINNVLIGGGKTSDYFTENLLKESNEIFIEVPIFKTPSSIEDVQNNYIEFEDSNVNIELR